MKTLLLLSNLCLLSTSAAFAQPLSPYEYQQLAKSFEGRQGECDPNISLLDSVTNTRYAFEQNLVTRKAYTWAILNDTYPILSRNLQDIVLICKREIQKIEPLTLTQYMRLSYESERSGLCTESVSREQAETMLNQAYNAGLIEEYPYDWGMRNGVYPVVPHGSNTITKVCRVN